MLTLYLSRFDYFELSKEYLFWILFFLLRKMFEMERFIKILALFLFVTVVEMWFFAIRLFIYSRLADHLRCYAFIHGIVVDSLS